MAVREIVCVESKISRPRLLSDTKVRLLTVAFWEEPQLTKKVEEEAEETREKQRRVKTHKVETFRLIIANDETEEVTNESWKRVQEQRGKWVITKSLGHRDCLGEDKSKGGKKVKCVCKESFHMNTKRFYTCWREEKVWKVVI